MLCPICELCVIVKSKYNQFYLIIRGSTRWFPNSNIINISLPFHCEDDPFLYRTYSYSLFISVFRSLRVKSTFKHSTLTPGYNCCEGGRLILAIENHATLLYTLSQLSTLGQSVMKYETLLLAEAFLE